MILFKKQKEQKEPKKEVETHRSSGDYLNILIFPHFYETVPKFTRFDCFQTLCKLRQYLFPLYSGSNGRLCRLERLESPASDENMDLVLPRINGCKVTGNDDSDDDIISYSDDDE